MRFRILYFSGTGNTKRIAQNLQTELTCRGWTGSVISIEEVLDDRLLIDDIDIIGIAFPVYKLTYPTIFDKVLPLLKAAEESWNQPVPAFVLSTYCRFEGSALERMTAELETRGCQVIAQRAFKSPSNGIASLQSNDSFEYQSVMYFEHGIGRAVSDFAETITEIDFPFERTRPPSFRYSDQLKLKIVERIERARYPEISIDSDLCTRCGMCAANCPEHNLIVETDHIRIVDRYECLHCLRCLHICRRHAISFGPLVRGPNRYTPEVIKDLYQEADKRSDRKEEPGTMTVRRKWAIRNLRYWLFRY